MTFYEKNIFIKRHNLFKKVVVSLNYKIRQKIKKKIVQSFYKKNKGQT